jgi:hypothetical protein
MPITVLVVALRTLVPDRRASLISGIVAVKLTAG